ncbi:Phosphate transport system permease protein PstC [Thalassovita gelatinovora]|uniref:Phosphate transport system permease protein n=1 Tax=Thalassovita gelatinovora TaxID=53501 RepID=A0A0P1FP00_THAGE|nr:phosphate ABC transporter permease subunit PstC [Thalassovita gelatinovora]QIZ79464.1 phosphate ABC transporter permease subunit PstC [Thalassovita gelatinovora]CUH62833.1 Phosphate transport system permease protein PstC [Thalassovita gelatinovora]SEQ11223.1 phosphate ABC transporter membrane protein 1, PhoT family [Thalassovita gelatinovora]
MSAGLVILIVLLIAFVGFFLGRTRAYKSAGGDIRKLHSRPNYYGLTVAIYAAVPALLFTILWLLLQPLYIESQVSKMIDAVDIPDGGSLDLVMTDVRRISDGLDVAVNAGTMTEDQIATMRADLSDLRARLGEVGIAVASDVQQNVLDAAREYRKLSTKLQIAMSVIVIGLSLAGAFISMMRIQPDYRARNTSEHAIKALLILSSFVAILTTLGIISSLLFETVHFFQLYRASDFFFNLTWNPQFRGGSDLGILPLLWGTLYVSFVALIFAVPIGLLAAIYLSEYASKNVRSFAKPAIEVLAGIPTIVYGLFALITVGPLLRDYFAQPLGMGNSSSSVLTAGIVLGVMLIPFVSSLSDDVINAVPQAMRDGSYGLGATKSETIKQVILPAALPGVVGAVLLAASRAIGETMIVVMGAGAAAKLSLNPFEAMTTITVKIVSQLTGDTEFASPETLVAFALGLSLFVVTLGLNILALYIVRKYREQYE